MASFDLEIHHKIVLQALEELDEIFKANGIQYYLIEGSALGAVRHQGIIPWDDDVDIGIFLKDRDRVSELLKKGLSSSFQWLDIRTEKKHPRFFGKIVHAGRGCIDVFPLIKTSEIESKRKIQWMKRKVFFKLYKAKLDYTNYMEVRNKKERFKVILAKIVSIFFSKSFILKMNKKNEYKYENSSDCKYYINLYGAYSSEKELIDKRWIGNGRLTKFGNKDYPIFQDTHSYLSHLYGNYMTPPPIDKRSPHHDEIF